MCGLPFKNGLFAMGCKNSVRSNNPILWIRSSGTKFGFGEPTRFSFSRFGPGFGPFGLSFKDF